MTLEIALAATGVTGVFMIVVAFYLWFFLSKSNSICLSIE